MNSLRRRPFLASFALAIAAPALAQSTHLVGVGGFAQIRQALAVAQPGDTILVQPGNYAHFEMNVGVTLRAVTAGTAFVNYDPSYFVGPCQNPSCTNEGLTSFAIPAGQEALVQGIEFSPTIASVPGYTIKHRVSAAGKICFEACRFRAFDNPAFGASGAELRLIRCTIASEPSTFGVPACILFACTVSAVDCTLEHQGALFTTSIASALLLDNSVLHGSRLNIRGNNTSGLSAGRGLVAIQGQAWISDSTIVGGNGRCAIEGAAFVTVARTTVQHGVGGCGAAATAPLLGVGTPAAVQTGGNYSLQFFGTPNTYVAVFAAPALGNLTLADVVQPIQIDPATAFAAGLSAIGPSGTVSMTWAIPAQPSVIGLPIWFQGFTGFLLPLQASAVAGGIAR